MKATMGITLVALAVTTADSEWIAVPIALMATGMWLLKGWVGKDVEM